MAFSSAANDRWRLTQGVFRFSSVNDASRPEADLRPLPDVERFNRTSKENLLLVRTFQTIQKPAPGTARLPQDLHRTSLIERHGFLVPAAFPTTAASTRRARGVGFNPVSHQPRPV